MQVIYLFLAITPDTANLQSLLEAVVGMPPDDVLWRTNNRYENTNFYISIKHRLHSYRCLKTIDISLPGCWYANAQYLAAYQQRLFNITTNHKL